MSNNTKHKIKLTEIEMNMILETVRKTGYAGEIAEVVVSVKRKMTVKQPEPKEPEKQSVANLVSKLPKKEN